MNYMTPRPMGEAEPKAGMTTATRVKLFLAALFVAGAVWYVAKTPIQEFSYKSNKRRRRRAMTPNGHGAYDANGRRLSKSQLVERVAREAGIEKSEVRATLAGLQEVVKKQLAPGGPGEVMIPGVLKLKTKKVKARKRRKGVNPFTGEQQWFKAKPATRKVKATILKDVRVAAAKKRSKRS